MLQYSATPVSPGLVIGPARPVSHHAAPTRHTPGTPAAEGRLLEAACRRARIELEELAAMAAPGAGRDILQMQRAILEDPEWLAQINAGIAAGAGAPAAVGQAAAHFATQLGALNDAYFTARAADIEDVARRLTDILAGRQQWHIRLDAPVILVAQDLYPSDLAGIERQHLLGVVLAGGSPQGHAAIIARTLGVPAVIGAGSAVLATPAGTELALDGGRGEVYIQPNDAVRARFFHQMRLARRRVLYLETLRTTPCVTADGTHIQLLANCSDPQDIRHAMAAGADGVGLLRTEFLFLQGQIPSEETQLALYRQCIAAAGGAPITVRTLDVGADKPLPGLTDGGAPNPALGLRGIRLGLAYEKLLTTQLRALLRAAAEGPLAILLPMLASPDEFYAAAALLQKARAALAAEGLAAGDAPLGVMIETPAAALRSAELAAQAAFFSIGTNDLTQYTLAADRTDPAVADYYRPQDPAVESLIALTLQNAAAAGIPCCICGESAADPALAQRYVQLGARRLSMAAASLAEVKDALNGLRLTGAPAFATLPTPPTGGPAAQNGRTDTAWTGPAPTLPDGAAGAPAAPCIPVAAAAAVPAEGAVMAVSPDTAEG